MWLEGEKQRPGEAEVLLHSIHREDKAQISDGIRWTVGGENKKPEEEESTGRMGRSLEKTRVFRGNPPVAKIG